jgi:hypothetical protein
MSQSGASNVTSAENSAPVHAVNQSSRKGNGSPPTPRHTPRPHTDSRVATKSQFSRCGFDAHTKDKPYPAKGKQCDKCKKFNHLKFNHFASVCKSSKKHYQSVAEIKTHDDDYDSDCPVFDLFTDSIDSSVNVNNNQAFVKLQVQGMLVPFKIDTGSQVDIIPQHLYLKLGSPNLTHDTTCKLYVYAGSPLVYKCITELQLAYKGKSFDTTFYVVDTHKNEEPVIIGLDTSVRLGVVKLVDTVKKTLEMLRLISRAY